jgi:hypothetical protein
MKQIPNEVVQALINYLAQRPYAEVTQFIQILSRLAPMPSSPLPHPENDPL